MKRAILLGVLLAGCRINTPNDGRSAVDHRSPAPPGSTAGRKNSNPEEKVLQKICETLLVAFETGDVKYQWEHLTDEVKIDNTGKPVYTFEQFQADYDRTREIAIREAHGARVKLAAAEGNIGSVLIVLGTGENRVQNFVRESGTWKYRPWKQ